MRQQVVGRTLIMTLLAAATAACSNDRALAPAAAGTGLAVRATENGGRTDTSLTTFTVRPGFGIVKTLNGGHQLVISPNAICDLSSSYGPTEWDQPCATETQTVVITARSWYDAAGHPRVDFQPAMRFNPAAQAVVLYLNDHSATTSGLRIDYCADGALTCVDESVADSSLLTYRNGTNGLWYRRIKHFSGYNIASGYSSTEMQ